MLVLILTLDHTIAEQENDFDGTMRLTTLGPRFTGILACMWHLAILGTRRRMLLTLNRTMANCLSQKEYMIALLGALGRTSEKAVVYVCFKLLKVRRISTELNRPPHADGAYKSLFWCQTVVLISIYVSNIAHDTKFHRPHQQSPY